MGLLTDRRILITGVLSTRSIAYGIAKACQREGATLAFTYVNDELKDRVARLAADFGTCPVLPCDVNVDEQVSLVALVWIGRGSYGADELDEVLETARAERVNPTADYLLGIPMLADYLEEGLEKLGYSVEDAEEDLL